MTEDLEVLIVRLRAGDASACAEAAEQLVRLHDAWERMYGEATQLREEIKGVVALRDKERTALLKERQDREKTPAMRNRRIERLERLLAMSAPGTDVDEQRWYARRDELLAHWLEE